MRKSILTLLLIIILFSFSAQKSFAQKTDTIVHINKNILTGELKKISYGMVSWRMTGMGTVDLEAVKVNTIITKKEFEIKLKNGITYYGSIDSSSVYRKVRIILKDESKLVNISDIVEAFPLRDNFWLRVTGDFSLGVNYSKGSDIATLVFSGDLNYRNEKSYYKINWDTNNTYQGDSLSSSKADVTLSWERTIKEDWSGLVSFGPSQNLELGSKLRWNFNLLGVRDLLYNDWNRLFIGAGLNLTRETPYDNSGITNDAAGVITMGWKVYKYNSPKVTVGADISFIPYFTDSGRYRAQFNLKPEVQVFNNDFKVGFKLYYTYDSKPTSGAVSKDDYGLNLQLTYRLHY